MPAQISNDPNSTPSVDPDTVDPLKTVEVNYHFTLANLGDEAGATTGWYWTLDGPDGTVREYDFITETTLEPGATFETGGDIAKDVITALEPGTSWVSLRDPDGNTMASASLVVTE